MVDIIITTINGVDCAILQNASLDLALGSDQNDFELSFTDEIDESLFGNGSHMYLDGTEYGGIVDKVTSDIENGVPVLTYAGRTWHGVLEKKILTPDTGQDYLKVSGSVSSVLTALISRVGLSELFTVAPNTTQISYQFDRYVTAYTGIRSMLAANNLKLMMTSNQHGVTLSVTPVTDMGTQADSDQLDFTLERDYRPVNHLIGLGKGELRDRAITHWYANGNGVVSQKQTLTGVDEIAATYDYSNAELAELNENTQKKLKELQSQGSLDIQLRDTEETYYVGDVLTGRDNSTGLTVSATVTKKIVKVAEGLLTVDYEVGKSSTSATSLSGSSESDSGGHAYYAGEGLNLTNYTFTAEVTQSELNVVSSDVASAVRQVSDLTAGVGKAQQTADSAVVSASSAQSTANTAVSKANAAQSTADSAVSAAGVAQTTAEAAQDTANSATSTAGSAVQSISAASPLTATRSGNIITLSAPAATPTSGGWMRMVDKVKLDGIDEGANAYTLPAASTSTLGGVKPDGKTITVSSDGTITAQSNSAASFLAAWPVGSIYHTSRSTNPGYVWGGTWRSLPSQGGYLWERLT